VSDSSLALDRELKAGLYAAAGIADYWIVDCRSRRVEVRREPIADQTALRRFRYGSTITLSPGEPIAPLPAPASLIDPSELLPRAR
ncbi:MAG TPA: Uma2 family endonuclease, partial [Pirellulales bacterium]